MCHDCAVSPWGQRAETSQTPVLSRVTRVVRRSSCALGRYIRHFFLFFVPSNSVPISPFGSRLTVSLSQLPVLLVETLPVCPLWPATDVRVIAKGVGQFHESSTQRVHLSWKTVKSLSLSNNVNESIKPTHPFGGNR